MPTEQNILKCCFSTFNRDFVTSGITMRKTKVKVLDIQLQEGKNKLKRLANIWGSGIKLLNNNGEQYANGNLDYWEITLSLIDFQNTRVISSPDWHTRQASEKEIVRQDKFKLITLVRGDAHRWYERIKWSKVMSDWVNVENSRASGKTSWSYE